MPDITKHPNLNDRLKQAFYITDEDLTANRAGQLSQAQQHRIQMENESAATVLWGCTFMAALITCTIVMIPVFKNSSNVLGPLLGLIVLGVFGFFGVVASREHFKGARTVDVQNVLSVQGKVKCYISTERRSYIPTLKIGKKVFRLGFDQYLAFVDGEIYLLYYTDTSNRIVAAEYVVPEGAF